MQVIGFHNPTEEYGFLSNWYPSYFIKDNVEFASVARRLGHSSMTTTQKTYLHIIQELENKDIDLVMRSLSSLN